MPDDMPSPAAQSARSQTAFDWPLYADATLAGLAVLVPIPLLDWLLEQLFRRRMVPAIARRYGQPLTPAIQAELALSQRSCLASCIGLVFAATFGLAKRVSRKLLYFLTIKDASEQLSFYWQRAFLIRHMIEAGHLESVDSARLARQAMDQVLEVSSSPLRGVARQVIAGTRNVGLTLLRARRGHTDALIQQTETRMRQNWASVSGYLTTVANQYDHVYDRLRTSATAGPAPLHQ